MEKISYRWAIWVSFVLFCIFGVSVILFALASLSDIIHSPSYVFGNLTGQAIIFYFLIYIPARIIYERELRKKKK